jgi:hypothetical protein
VRTSDGGWSPDGDDDLAWWSVTWSSGMSMWERQHTRNLESKLADETPRTGFNWLCPAIALLKSLFCECGVSPRWKSIIYDRCVCTVVFGEDGLLVLSCDV